MNDKTFTTTEKRMQWTYLELFLQYFCITSYQSRNIVSLPTTKKTLIIKISNFSQPNPPPNHFIPHFRLRHNPLIQQKPTHINHPLNTDPYPNPNSFHTKPHRLREISQKPLDGRHDKWAVALQNSLNTTGEALIKTRLIFPVCRGITTCVNNQSGSENREHASHAPLRGRSDD